ncbi:DUF4084 domain-containing protein [Domibacillus indicus]|uniref:DUF4084 domain-containing protein n=1 Tax=Domibacillus indicus TaxID=1437523 RepID=UPI0009E5CCC3|nr:DUF4084 domain-containing protein [Domibacillus indicus]
MDYKKTNLFWMFFIIIFIASYYIWIMVWKGETEVLTWGGNFFSLLGSLIGAVWLGAAFKRSRRPDMFFWLFLFLGSFSYFLAELLWMYYESILGKETPFPGSPDLFYILQMVFFLAAFVSRIKKQKKQLELARFLFDMTIMMTVAFTFSWQYIIRPIMLQPDSTHFALGISLAYPVGDLALLVSALSIYFSRRETLQPNIAFFIFAGLIVQISADTIFLYFVSIDQYFSGSLVDPLFILGLLLVGFAGILQKTEPADSREARAEKPVVPKTDFLRLSLPYINVAVLFVFMIVRSHELDAVTIGCAVSIILVMIRQVFMILENRRLLDTLSQKAEELEISKERYKSLFEYHPDAVYSLDLEGNFESVNTAGAALLGYEQKELAGMPLSSLAASIPEHSPKTGRDYLSKLTEARSQSYELSFCNKMGEFYHMNVTNIPIIVKNKMVGIFGIGKDITENKKNEEQIKYLAYRDSLTGLFNRARFEKELAQTAAAAEQANEAFAVFFIDLDRFKNINDTLGHDIGDQLLKAVADRLKNCVRDKDIVARQGGDEFTLLIKGLSGREEAEQAAGTILDSLHKPYHIKGHEIASTPSIGAAFYDGNGTAPDSMLKKADLAMYQVKENGKGHYRFYSETGQHFLKKTLIEKDLGQALQKQELFLHYQPQIDVERGEIIGLEALLRWNHPSLGVVFPGDFVPLAEETGLILPIGNWVLYEACRQVKKWNDEGHRVKVAVNLSPYQLYQENLVDTVAEILKETNAEPHFIELEITETTALNQLNDVIFKLQALKQLGITISIDDFGTGYSSLSYLAGYPVDRVKIAREFISKIGSSKAGQTVLTSIVHLARNLDLHVIAEGVESESQASVLKEVNCREMQGYLFGKPVSAAEIDQQFKKQKKSGCAHLHEAAGADGTE